VTARLVLVVLKDLRQDFENLLEDSVGRSDRKEENGIEKGH
jgi:hypothetical protein